MRKTIWITRDSKGSSEENVIYMWAIEPHKDEDGDFSSDKDSKNFGMFNFGMFDKEPVPVLEYSIKDFKKYFGFTPRRGSKVKTGLQISLWARLWFFWFNMGGMGENRQRDIVRI